MQKIAIHSVPRSGSTWLGSIMDSSPDVNYKKQPLFSYTFKNYLNEHSTSERIEKFFNEIANSKDPFTCQVEEKARGIIPDFKKSESYTHICYKEVRYHHIIENLFRSDTKIKVIGLIRNPFAVINSWLKAPKEFRADLNWKPEEEWKYASKKNLGKVEEYNGYKKWTEVAHLFLKFRKEFPDHFYLVEYEKLLANPVTEVKKLFNFSEIDLHHQTIDFIKTSMSEDIEDAYSVYKKKIQDDSWKTELPDFILQEIENDPEFRGLNEEFHWI